MVTAPSAVAPRPAAPSNARQRSQHRRELDRRQADLQHPPHIRISTNTGTPRQDAATASAVNTDGIATQTITGPGRVSKDIAEESSTDFRKYVREGPLDWQRESSTEFNRRPGDAVQSLRSIRDEFGRSIHQLSQDHRNAPLLVSSPCPSTIFLPVSGTVDRERNWQACPLEHAQSSSKDDLVSLPDLSAGFHTLHDSRDAQNIQPADYGTVAHGLDSMHRLAFDQLLAQCLTEYNSSSAWPPISIAVPSLAGDSHTAASTTGSQTSSRTPAYQPQQVVSHASLQPTIFPIRRRQRGPHTCSECKKVFRLAKEYERHPCTRFSCEYCSRTFARKQYVTRHQENSCESIPVESLRVLLDAKHRRSTRSQSSAANESQATDAINAGYAEADRLLHSPGSHHTWQTGAANHDDLYSAISVGEDSELTDMGSWYLPIDPQLTDASFQ